MRLSALHALCLMLTFCTSIRQVEFTANAFGATVSAEQVRKTAQSTQSRKIATHISHLASDHQQTRLLAQKSLRYLAHSAKSSTTSELIAQLKMAATQGSLETQLSAIDLLITITETQTQDDIILMAEDAWTQIKQSNSLLSRKFLADLRERRAIQLFEAKGAIFSGDELAIDEAFKGNQKVFRQLRHLANTRRISLTKPAKFENSDVAHLAQARQLIQIDLRSCPGVSHQRVAKLRKEMPGAQITLHRGAYLGVHMAAKQPGDGAHLEKVYESTPAEKAGMQATDVVTHFNGHKIKTYLELRQQISHCAAGDTVKIGIRRQGKPAMLTVTLGDKY